MRPTACPSKSSSMPVSDMSSIDAGLCTWLDLLLQSTSGVGLAGSRRCPRRRCRRRCRCRRCRRRCQSFRGSVCGSRCRFAVSDRGVSRFAVSDRGVSRFADRIEVSVVSRIVRFADPVSEVSVVSRIVSVDPPGTAACRRRCQSFRGSGRFADRGVSRFADQGTEVSVVSRIVFAGTVGGGVSRFAVSN